MEIGGYPILECNGIAVHPATHPVSALDFERSVDLNGHGPFGPKLFASKVPQGTHSTYACGELSVAASEAALSMLRLASLVHSLAIQTGARFRKESTHMTVL